MPVEQLREGTFSQRKKTTWRLHNYNEFPPSFTLLVTFHPSLPKASSYPSFQGPKPRHKLFLCCFSPSVTLQGQGLHNTDPSCPFQPFWTNSRVKPFSTLPWGKDPRYSNRASLYSVVMAWKNSQFLDQHILTLLLKRSKQNGYLQLYSRDTPTPCFKHPIWFIKVQCILCCIGHNTLHWYCGSTPYISSFSIYVISYV